MDYEAFVLGEKTLLVAPAGYGKTHTIVECLKHTSGLQLVLTHTHAGLASIKEKIKKEDIPSSNYQIETISSFAQKYAHAFYVGEDLPDQDSNNYHSFIIDAAKTIFGSNSASRVLKNTYQGVFVDEYQDCSKPQHAMLMKIAEVMPMHIFGDPLQGIFDFNGEAVDFENDLSEFEKFQNLETPHRWRQEGGNPELGEQIKEYRSLLESNNKIPLVKNDEIGLHINITNENDFHKKDSPYRQWLKQLVKGDTSYGSLLIIAPPDQPIKSRAKIRSSIDPAKSLTVLEAIDDKMFYTLAKNSDALISQISRADNPAREVREKVLANIFIKTGLEKWFGTNGVKRKKDSADREKATQIQITIDGFVSSNSAGALRAVIKEVKSILGVNYLRDELYYSLDKALENSNLSKQSVYECMKENRNTIRRVGRKEKNKCIGTTLLTKGLEFDTVSILDAHKFKCAKHLYVALSRGRKKLIIFSESPELSLD